MPTARVASVHAIERLRWIAGAPWAPAGELAAEAAWALGDLAEQAPAALVPSCRRLLERHPGCGALWWVAASVLAAADPVGVAQDCADALIGDPTEDRLADALADGRRAVRRGSFHDVAGAEVVVVEVEAVGVAGMVVEPGRRSLIEAARSVGVPIWLVAGVGRLLPARLFGAVAARCGGGDPGAAGAAGGRRGAMAPVLLDLAGVDQVAGPLGVADLDQVLAASTGPEPPELLGDWQPAR